MKRTVITLVVLFSLISCSVERNPQPQAAEDFSEGVTPLPGINPLHGLPDTGEPAMHAVQNSRLQIVMQQLNRLVYDQLGSEIELSAEREVKTAEIARIAAELADSEEAIIGTLPALNLKDDEKLAFKSLAEKLRIGALDLQELAKEDKLQEVPTAIETLTNTCISCHVLFRKSRSLLEKCKDPRYTC